MGFTITSTEVAERAQQRLLQAPRSGYGDDADLGAAIRNKIANGEITDPALPDDSGAVAILDERRRLVSYLRSQDAVIPNLVMRGAIQGLAVSAGCQVAAWLWRSR